jgi:hypothetical protein
MQTIKPIDSQVVEYCRFPTVVVQDADISLFPTCSEQEMQELLNLMKQRCKKSEYRLVLKSENLFYVAHGCEALLERIVSEYHKRNAKTIASDDQKETSSTKK